MNILNIKPGIKTYTISIPEQLFKSPLKVIYSFIAGLIDSDGHISKSRKRITFDTVSKELAEQVVCLISLLGYSPAIREKKSKRKNHSIIYEVKIDSDFMIDFTKKIKPFVNLYTLIIFTLRCHAVITTNANTSHSFDAHA